MPSRRPPTEGPPPPRMPSPRATTRPYLVSTGLMALAGVGLLLFAAKEADAPIRATGKASIKSTEDGGHVRWKKEAIDVVVDKSFTEIAGSALLGGAIDAWRKTGASLPSISTRPGEERQVGYDRNGKNENVIVYAPFGWAKARGALAVTVLTYDAMSGAILDADLLVNGGGRFFASFDRDESHNEEPVSIENGTWSEPSSPKPGGTSRYDLPSVVTHELGHFFGLGEDFDDSKATMFATTKTGEINKRAPTQSDASVITTLYAESTPEEAQAGGCGGGRLARGHFALPRPAIAFIVGALCLALGRARWRSVRRGLVALALAVMLVPPELRAASSSTGPLGDAEVEVLRARPRWTDGIVETELTFRVTTCHLADCPDSEQHVKVAGGKLGSIVQVVGPFAIPEVGTHVRVAMRDGRGMLRVLAPMFRP